MPSFSEQDLKVFCDLYTCGKLSEMNKPLGKKLKKIGVIFEDFSITEYGEIFYTKCNKIFEEWEKGVPLNKMPKTKDSQLIVLKKISAKWISVTIRKQVVLIDPSKVFMLTTNINDVGHKRIGKKEQSKFQEGLSDLLAEYSKGSIEAVPKLFQRTKEGEDFIWLHSDNSWVCVQAKFFYLVQNLYKNVQFFVTESERAVFVKSQNAGIDGVTALIMAMEGVVCENAQTGEE